MNIAAKNLLNYIESCGITKIEFRGSGDAEWVELTGGINERISGKKREFRHHGRGMWKGKDLQHAVNRRKRFPLKPDEVEGR